MKKTQKTQYKISLLIGIITIFSSTILLNSMGGSACCIGIITVIVSLAMLSADVKRDLITAILCIGCCAITPIYFISDAGWCNVEVTTNIILTVFFAINVSLLFVFLKRMSKAHSKKQRKEGIQLVTLRYKS